MGISTMGMLLPILVRLCTLVWRTKGRTGRVPMDLGVGLSLGLRMSMVRHPRRRLGSLVSTSRIIRPTRVMLMTMFETCPPTSRAALVPTPCTSGIIPSSHAATCTTGVFISCTTSTTERTLWIVGGAPETR